MLCIHLKNTDPYFCLAAEEYLLKNFSEDIFMLWQSENAVVVGKHQNVAAEINHRFVNENNIAVCRRISGGGTVFHDAGNVNFTFIKNVKSPAEISFKQFTAPVVDALAKLGIEATTSGRNDLLIDGLKISGNAEHVYKNRVLHHGTLLFNSDLENLGQAIKVTPGKYEGKAVQSNRSPVANISQFLQTPMTTAEFVQFLLGVQLENPGNSIYNLNENDIQTIEKLADEKFRTWEWNFGYSPKYTFRNEVEIERKTLSVMLVVEKGVIVEVEVGGEYFQKEQSLQIRKILHGQKHYLHEIITIQDLPESLS
ncbi:MAG: lipoate--protein ligase, partial [Bacteroidetes bacterium]